MKMHASPRSVTGGVGLHLTLSSRNERADVFVATSACRASIPPNRIAFPKRGCLRLCDGRERRRNIEQVRATPSIVSMFWHGGPLPVNASWRVTFTRFGPLRQMPLLDDELDEAVPLFASGGSAV